MAGLSLEQILQDLDTQSSAPAPAVKTAADASKEAPKVAQAKSELLDALKRAESASKSDEKTAAAQGTPATELTKIATDLAAADQEALVKEAQFYGASIADGFMARLQQYEKSAEQLPAAKTAAAVDVEKIAEEAVRGYIETQNQLKVAAAKDYENGYKQTMEWAEKTAQDLFNAGIEECGKVLAEARK